MPIRINEYNGFIIKFLLPVWVIFLLTIIGCTICYIVAPNEMQGCFYWFIGFIVSFIIISALLLVAKFGKPGEWYLFDEKTIQVCKKNGEVETIDISEVEIIKYHPFRLRYIITIFFGELNEGGAWRLFFKFKDGTIKEVGFLDLKSVEKIKGLYGDLITIC